MIRQSTPPLARVSLSWGILAFIAEFENGISRERHKARAANGRIAKAKAQGVKFGRKREVTPERAAEIKSLREAGSTRARDKRRTGLSKSEHLSNAWTMTNAAH